MITHTGVIIISASEDIHVLVVEDEQPIRRMIIIQLQRSGFKVQEASTGEEAFTRIKEQYPDLVVLDVRLPDMSGFEICEKLRNEYPDIAILLLTALSQDMDKLTGLELGADDYMVKPFNPLELTARIRAILRRMNKDKKEAKSLGSGPFRLDLQSGELYLKEKRVELTPKEYSLIYHFLLHPGKVFSREELLNDVWGTDFFGDQKTVDVHIRRIREKIEEDPAHPQWIETVWGTGYRWKRNS
ncbi:response regulator transcription factor [Bacillus horti]|uniref:DNA-binding response OmpR family regulator n=1 Tax=Caldalkalibacillus horti TaxID=77523 RepID=A0ABT9VYZ5_9BACI|nr:response regulator transcription factor [Bacillus horti]MDQ0166216.1 DNA-binding response OmpR family regulator [Bacillus horti]